MTQPLPATNDEVSTSERRQTILVVDDEQDLRSLVANVLGEYGYKVITAANAAKAITMLEKMDAPPDLLLTDVVMPGMNGRVLAEQLLPRQPGMRVLYMSGYTDSFIAGHGVLEPGTYLVHKPFTEEELIRKVREVLDYRKKTVPAIGDVAELAGTSSGAASRRN